MTPLRMFTLLSPVIGLAFAVVFLALWNQHRGLRHILLMAGAAGSFAAAVTFQILIPIVPAYGVPTIVSAIFYVVCIGLFIEAVLTRAGLPGNMKWLLPLLVLILCLHAFFLHVYEDVAMRIYVLNLGCGALLVITAFRLHMAPAHKPIDRVLFLVVLITGLHFLPRTILTLPVAGPGGVENLDTYRMVLFFALVSLVIVLWLTFLLAVSLDIIETLSVERNSDALTPLLNRRAFQEEAQLRLQAPSLKQACLVFIDIDHFKAINDALGHAAGDQVISAVGRWICEAVRHSDVAGRIGGEEFAILMPDADLRAGGQLCERLRQRVQAGEPGILPVTWRVTASFGLAEFRQGDTLAQLMERADDRLYAAKRNGRNRVEGWGNEGGALLHT